MEPQRIAVATTCFGQPLKQAICTAAEMGVQGVQLDVRNELKPSELSQSGRREFVHLLTERGLSVASVSFPTRRALWDEDQLEARVTAIKNAMQFAVQLQSHVLTLRIGRLPENETSPVAERLYAVLNDLARYGNHVGAELAVTATNDSPAALQRAFSRITEGPVGLDFDPASFVISGHKPLDAFQLLYGSIMHIQVRDAVRDMDGAGLEVVVGRGEVEWPALLALIDHSNYPGWLTIHRTQGDNKIQDAARCVQFLRQAAIP